MKKLVHTVTVLFLTTQLYAQNFYGDSLITVVNSTDNDSLKMDAALGIFLNFQRAQSDSALCYARQLLSIGRQKKDRLIEAMGLLNVGFVYGRTGNRVAWMDNSLQALRIGEEIQNNTIISMAYNMIAAPESYVSMDTALAFQRKAIALKGETKPDDLLEIFYINLSYLYLKNNHLDSARKYAQKAYKCWQYLNNKNADIWVFKMLGDVQLRSGDAPPKSKDVKPDYKLYKLALPYYKRVLHIASLTNRERDYVIAYSCLGNYYDHIKQEDSAFYYESKTLQTTQKNMFITKVIPAKWIYQYYKKKNNIDSALKYYEIATAANDSVNNSNVILQLQNMSFAEEQRQHEAQIKQEQEIERRNHNLQLVVVAIVVLTSVIIFLVFSTNIKATEKQIKLLGIIALLMVFEFINLLLHSSLQSITNDSPGLMLLSLVAIAALIVPFHHRLEKWMIKQLVEKNNARKVLHAKKVAEEQAKINSQIKKEIV